MVRYFNYDYDKSEYYEVDFPLHDHYTYNSLEDCWYEIILNLKGDILDYIWNEEEDF